MNDSVRRGFSIRTKLTLVALLLLLIPLMSYIYVRDMKVFLIKGQENALSLTARAVSTVLHDRPELFARKRKSAKQDEEKPDIYVVPLANYVRLDGQLEDWGDQISQASTIKETVAGDERDKIRHMLGYRGSYLYAFLEVTDENVVYRGREFLRTDNADHIRITIKSPNLAAKRYALTAREPGTMSVYLVDKEWVYPTDGKPSNDIRAELVETDSGYVVETRVPRFLLAGNAGIQIQVVDVDNADERGIQSIISTTASNDSDEFSRILLQTPEIDNILRGLNRSDARIWVLDSEKRVRTVVGNLSSRTTHVDKPPTSYLEWAKFYYKRALDYVFKLILDQPNTNIQDLSGDTESRSDQLLELALQGQSITDRRASLDNQTVIIMAAHPIWSGNSVIGSVVVEQSSNEVLSQQREALESVISVTLLVLLIVLSSMLFFASRLTLRIRRLRNSADNAIDRHGRIQVQQLVAESKAGDEVGDLSRSISNMLSRLAQYTHYLRGLPDTLSHEVSNPLNVVNSSLHNLATEHPLTQDSKYFKRAQNGLNRIRSILTNLTEAANLEQAMEAESFVLFDLVKLVGNYVEGYQSSNPEKSFTFKSLSKALFIEGTPDHIAQMLDKLVDNAMDFAQPGTDIVIRIRRDEEQALIDVINEGSELPDNMQERIFEPMVSLGRKDAQKSKLGMGLYVVRLIATYHGGRVTARNLRTRRGVIFTVSLPIAGGFLEPMKIAPKL